MRIAYNPKTAQALMSAPNNEDITFDLSGLAIYVKGVKFEGKVYSVFKKHTLNTTGGYDGLVPAPSYTETITRYLREDGTWVVPTNTTYDVVSSSANGLAPKVINTNTATVGSAYYVLASTDGSTSPSWYKLPANAFKNDNTIYTFVSGNGGFTVTPSGGTAQVVSIGKVDWANITNKPDTFTPSAHTHATDNITKLTSYTKATSASDLATTDTLNIALGKLEYKADTAYDWIIGVTATDTDEYINKWGEVVGFLDSVKEGTDILDEFVTRKTDLTITGIKTFKNSADSSTTTIKNGLILINANTYGGWTRGMTLSNTDTNASGETTTVSATIGVFGSGCGPQHTGDNSIWYLYMSHLGLEYHNAVFKVYSNKATISGNEIYHKGNLKNLSDLNDDIVSGKYLPLTGGTLTGNISAPAYLLGNGKGTYIDSGADNTLVFYDNTARRTVIHSGNISLQNVAGAYKLISLYVGDLNGAEADRFFRSGFQASNRPSHHNYATGISLYNSELKYKYQLTFDTYGTLYTRYLNSSNTWSGWNQIASIADIPTKVSQLTNDAGYTTATGHTHAYLPLTGGTLTGPLTLKGELYSGNYALDLKNSNIIGVNSIIMLDLANDAGEGILFKRSNGNHDSIWASDGVLYFSPNGTYGTSTNFPTKHTIYHTGNLTSLPANGGNADTANKLTTPRKIWGQDFDGSGNVSGSIDNCNWVRCSKDSSGSGFIIGRGEEISGTSGLGLWTSGDAPIFFGAGSAELMRIAGNGNVGIGVTDPQYKLDVNGIASAHGYVGAGICLNWNDVWNDGKDINPWHGLKINGSTSVYDVVLSGYYGVTLKTYAGMLCVSQYGGVTIGPGDLASSDYKHPKLYVDGEIVARGDMGNTIENKTLIQHNCPLEVGRTTNTMSVAIGVTDDDYGIIQSKGHNITSSGKLAINPQGGDVYIGGSTATGFDPKVTITHGGNVGVNTTKPNATLAVVGNFCVNRTSTDLPTNTILKMACSDGNASIDANDNDDAYCQINFNVQGKRRVEITSNDQTNFYSNVRITGGHDLELCAPDAQPNDAGDIVFCNNARQELGRIWLDQAEPIHFRVRTDPSGYGYVLLHSGNISSYAITTHQSLANYLPLTGGTLTGDNNILNLSGITNSYIYYRLGSTNKASSGYYENFAFIANEKTYARIGVADDGTPQYHTDNHKTNVYTLLHSGIAYINNGTVTINGTSITPLTSHQSLVNYVTLNTALTITGEKTFASNTFRLSGVEHSDIKHSSQLAYNWGGYGGTNSTPNYTGMYNSLDFQWYGDTWSIGNLRSSGSTTNGFGIGLKKNNNNGDLYFAPAFRITETESYINNNKIWHSGNDGSGSGLDADLLDGYHESSFLRYRDLGSNGGATLWSQIGIRSYHGALPEGLSGIYNYGEVVSLPGSGSRLDIFTNHFGSSESGGLGGLWWRSGWNDDKKSWRRIIDSGNIASLSVNYATSAATLSGGSIATWGTLTAANGFTNVCTWDTGGTTGAFSLAGKGGQMSLQLDGFFYQNEGRYMVLDTNNISSYALTSLPSHTHAYLPLSGGTMTGPLTFANGTWNVVGDDAAIGDYNAAGMLGLKSVNNNIPGIGFHNSSNTLLGRLQASGSTLLWNDQTIIHSGNIGSQSVNYAVTAPAAANWGGTDTTTKIKVKINSTEYWMLSFVVTIYQGYKSSKIMVSGYNYGSSYWWQPEAVLLGDSDGATSITVYFGYDSVSNLWVGFDGGNYTGVSISDVTNGYVQISSLKDLFTISNVSSLSTILTTVTATNSVNYANSAAYATSAGNADTVDSLHASAFMRAVSDGSYYGMQDPAASTSNWIRTTSSGLIPYSSGGASSLGTSSWPFSTVYANNFYGYLNGNISGSSASVRDVGNGTAITFSYSTGGFTSNPSWLAAWNGYKLTYVSPSVLSVNYANSAGSVAWGNITGKPSTFTPSSHTHAYLPLAGGTMDTTALILAYTRSKGSGDIYNGAILLREATGSATACADNMYDAPGITFHWRGRWVHKLNMHSNALYWDNSKLWHDGNDGSGSGLDADIVDGYHIWVGSSSSLPANKINNTIYITI